MGERLLVCGDRHWPWERRGPIYAYVEYWHRVGGGVDVLIEGECPNGGADFIGRRAAEDLGIPVLPFPANWKRFGGAAGPIRNQQMLDEGKPTRVGAFHDDLAHSKGTRDMVVRARRAGIPVDVYASDAALAATQPQKPEGKP